MLTLETLKSFGADTEEGLTRCMGKEAFYLRMIDMGIKDQRFEALGKALEAKDLDEAFEIAHALKGIVGNLALSPIYGPMNEITESLRAKKEIDYASLYQEVMEKRSKLLEA